jgi:hypothetical protein
MNSPRSQYQSLIDRVLLATLTELNFRPVKLRDSISYEVLFRKDDLWFGTSWDLRDRYLDLDFGHLYWMKDVMPRVIITGHYSSFCDDVKRLDESRSDYLDVVVATVAASLADAVEKYRKNPSLAESQLFKLRPFILEQVVDTKLVAYEMP